MTTRKDDLEYQIQKYRDANQHKITDEILDYVDMWLGDDGIQFFNECLRDYGTVSPVILGALPHPVHFREGMQVRNAIRDSGLAADWVGQDHDNLWSVVVKRILDRHSDPTSTNLKV